MIHISVEKNPEKGVEDDLECYKDLDRLSPNAKNYILHIPFPSDLNQPKKNLMISAF